MPNIKSAKKRVKVTQKKTLQNKMFKSAMKTEIRKMPPMGTLPQSVSIRQQTFEEVLHLL